VRGVRASRLLILLVALAPAACEESVREHARAELEGAAAPRAPVIITPDALLVRFREDQGVGFDRRGWEIEILQMGAEVRIRGAVRAAGTSIPIFRAMSTTEYESFWKWLEPFPLDQFRVKENESANEPGWRKSLDVDIVLDAERRVLSHNKWTRPIAGSPWLAEIEDRLHLMALEFADQALGSMDATPTTDPDEVQAGIRRAMEALGDAEITNLPGGSPDAK